MARPQPRNSGPYRSARTGPAAAYGPYWALLVGSLGIGGYLVTRLHLDQLRYLALFAVALAAAPVTLALTHALAPVLAAQTLLATLLSIVGIRAGLLVHDAVASNVRAGVSTGVGTLSWILFLPFSLFLGWLTRIHGVSWTGWAFTAVSAAVAGLLLLSGRRATRPAEIGELDAVGLDIIDVDVVPAGTYPPVPDDVACRELVHLVTDYLDGALPPAWRSGLEDHLASCDDCVGYLSQIREVIDSVERFAGAAGR